MPIQLINLGSSPNDGTGDTLRAAGAKCNNNFALITPLSAIDIPLIPAAHVTHDIGAPLSAFRHIYCHGLSAVNALSASVLSASVLSVSTISASEVSADTAVLTTLTSTSLSSFETQIVNLTSTSVSSSNITLQGTLDGYITIQGTLDGLITGPVVCSLSSPGNILSFYFANTASFPSPVTYHGAIAHSHADGRMYFAHGSAWHPLANATGLDPNNSLYSSFTSGYSALSAVEDSEARWDIAYMSVVTNSAAWFEGQGGGAGISIADGAAKVGAVSGMQTCWTGDGSTQTFTLPYSSVNAFDLIVDIGGVIQSPTNDYDVVTNTQTLCFFSPPPNTLDICVRRFVGDSFVGVPTNNVSDTLTANGSLTAFALSRDVHYDRDLLVTLDGLVQVPTLHYTLSTVGLSASELTAPYDTVVFDTPPTNGTRIEARHLSTSTVSAFTSAYTISLTEVSNITGLNITDVSNVSALSSATASPVSGTEVLKIIDLEPQLDRAWSPLDIPGLIAWFDPTPLSAGGGLGLSTTNTNQVTSWMPKGMYALDSVNYPGVSAWLGYDNSQYTATGSYGPEYEAAYGGGGYVHMKNGYFQDPLMTGTGTSTTENGYASLTGVAYTGFVAFVDSSQSNTGQLNTCCPPILDHNYHGNTGGVGTSLIDSVYSAGGISDGAAYVNGAYLHTFTQSTGSRSVGNVQKMASTRFIEILNDIETHNKTTCSGICKQSRYIDRQLWCTVSDLFFFDRHPTEYQRKKLFKWLQSRYLNSSGETKLWETGW